MILPASLTPPLGIVNQPTVLPVEAGRKRSASADLPNAIDASARAQGVPGRDLSRRDQAPVPSGERSGVSSLAENDRSPSRESAENQSSAQIGERLSLRQVLDMRARYETGEVVELPVPVTEILWVWLAGSPDEATAGINAKSLYETTRDVFSQGTPPAPRGEPPAPASQPVLRAA